MTEIEELRIRIEALERAAPSPSSSIIIINLPPGEYTQEEILRRYPWLSVRNLSQHIPAHYTRKRVRVYPPSQPPHKIWIYTSPEPDLTDCQGNP